MSKRKMAITFLAGLIFMLGIANNVPAHSNKDLHNALIKWLSRTADPVYIKKIFSDKRLTIVVPRKKRPLSKEKKRELFIKQFLNLIHPRSVFAGRVYIRAFEKTFDTAFKKYGIEPEIIAAIHRVETHFALYWGDNPAINTLYSIYLRNSKKREWAASELRYLIIFSRKNKRDIFDIPGSSAGAIGVGQFLPSSVFHYSADGNADGVENPFDFRDAIMSTARYLNENHYYKNLFGKVNAVYAYNHSILYVLKIIVYAELLKR